MQKFFPLCFIILFFSCQSEKDEISEIKFPYKNGFHSSYFTRSEYYNEEGQLLFADSIISNFDIIESYSDSSSRKYTWLLTPGFSEKDKADTMFTTIGSEGYFNWYNKNAFEGAEIKNNLIPLPLKASQSWESKFLNYPSLSYCVDTDTIIETNAGKFHCIRIDSEFYPDFLNDIFSDTINYRIKALHSDYYSQTAGRVLTTMDYYVESKVQGIKGYKVLSNQTTLIQLKK